MTGYNRLTVLLSHNRPVRFISIAAVLGVHLAAGDDY